ncbi:protein FAR1-RELATED SEQUENCE 5-like [Tasmannia lanceolata]|uniref:protein FAR1-RELATED SEQUENCE 5-like n=1 Tax=Tasmannia lanceolata TaxID=3420 RepID=UPI00406321AF
MELDINGNLRSMFWADSRARDAYLTFSDVIVFDVTYRTNKFRMPFAPFTGVNHHRQSTLFGCALLADEKEETFTWLFEQWLDCMFGRPPGCIITDMDGAMRNAIRSVFPNTHHRFCSWHISKYLLEHVPLMRDSTSDFPKDYKKWFYTRQKEDCEVAWENLVQKYNIEGDGWLAKMWDVRTHWLPAYFRDTFTAGMTSSACSESINSFFDGYVNQNTSLKEFVEQYDRALIERRRAESLEDFKSKTTKAVLVSRSKLEEEASKCYTKTMFDIFQVEFKDSIDCYHEKLEKNGVVVVYKVGLSVDEKWKWCRVVYDTSEDVKATCECAMFETKGILCKHILHIMSKKQLMSIPKQYILNRWTTGARYRVDSGVLTRELDSDDVSPLHRWCLITKFQRVVDRLTDNNTLFKKVNETLDAWLLDSEQEIREKQVDLATSGSQVQSNFVSQGGEISIRDPKLVRTKDRPKVATRFKSPLETFQSEPKHRTCKKCGGKGHYYTTCGKERKKKQKTTSRDGLEDNEHEEELGEEHEESMQEDVAS